ncbi:unnamed protein product [Pleuronectes platessa]|uniref:Uncharacterized protein n=1 Tax=Pleuronectes platessa TaxID=8262 RepID=A0A9N7UMX0_PLEPL|nr:unnamed protein product [Pleuronectes platessa]
MHVLFGSRACALEPRHCPSSTSSGFAPGTCQTESFEHIIEVCDASPSAKFDRWKNAPEPASRFRLMLFMAQHDAEMPTEDKAAGRRAVQRSAGC